MPELPEVETTRRGIAPHIEGQVLTQVLVHQPSLRWPIPQTSLLALQGEVVNQVVRRAKYLLLHTDQHYILLHLGMSGSLRVITDDAPRQKHDHLELCFANGKVLRLHDPRRFGCCLVQSKQEGDHPLLQKLGPEPLTELFSAEYLYKRSRNKQMAIKNFIMDNHIVVGVGNIYASESLFKSGIHPQLAAGKVSLARYKKLVEAIKQTLSASIEQGGTTLRDFVNSDGKPGYFQQTLLVYGRTGEPCTVCKAVIESVKIGQRNTFYCRQCQK